MRSLLFAALLPSVAAAQLASVAPGARVRIQAPPISLKPIVATLMRATSDTLWLSRPQPLRRGDTAFTVERIVVPTASILEMRVSQGRSRKLGAARGALIGAASALVLGVVASADAPSDSWFSPGAVIVLLEIAFVPPAAIVGAILGAEGWKKVYP